MVPLHQVNKLDDAYTLRREHTQQSRRLPPWLWKIIAKSLGIKLHSGDRPVISTVLYVLTLISAGAFVVTNTWFSGYNIVSIHTKDDIIDGTVSIFIVLFWCSLGIYSNKLAFRLFSHQRFVNMLRLHSKTILKLNAALVVLILMTAFIVINNLNSYVHWKDETCKTVEIEVIVCKLRYVSRVTFSVFMLAWNLLVAVVLISVCRTHTIGIRRFIRDLEQEAIMYSCQHGDGSYTTGDLNDEYVWIEEDYLEELADSDTEPLRKRAERSSNVSAMGAEAVEEESHTKSIFYCTEDTLLHEQDDSDGVNKFQADGNTCSTSSGVPLQPLTEKRDSADSPPTQLSSEPHLMTSAEILQKYWKISVKLRLASHALQRWMISVVILTVIWSSIYMVKWLSHDPALYGVLEFCLPLLLLPLFSSAYAEVNAEGKRVVGSIFPLNERVHMLDYLYQAPLAMTVFGYPISYSTISTVVAGILIAFASKILLKEMNDL